MAHKSVLFMGDIHGVFGELDKAMRRHKPNAKWDRLYQVGDFGLGFPEYTDLSTGKPFCGDPESFDPRIRWIRGNHDNPEQCRKYPGYMGDYGVEKDTGIFYVSGAFSIDRDFRTIGRDWWPDEELSYQDLQKAIDLYIETKPNVVMSHTAPEEITQRLMKGAHKRYSGQRTETALQTMFRYHKPKLWVFGHWHVVWDVNVEGTRFVCLGINQARLLPITDCRRKLC